MKLLARSAVALAGIAVGSLALASCGTPSGAPGASVSPAATATASDAPKLAVVASTNIYGQLASQIGGDFVAVTSIIDDVTTDPHTYEATAQDRLAVEQAQLVISNGGGYDAYIDTLLGEREVERVIAVESSHDYEHAVEGHGDDHDAADDHGHDDEAHADDHDDHADDHAEGHDHDGHEHIAGFNEHVWFDAHTMIHVVEAIADDLAELDPANASVFADNAAAIIADLEVVEAQLETLTSTAGGAAVFLTEPLPGYLVSAAGLTDKTPEGFAEAVEEGSDVAPAIMLAASTVIKNGEVKAVLANEQTSDAATQQIVTEAEAAGIPVARFTELLAPGQTYLDWLRAGIAALEQAVATP